ncbi:hypothetical protein [Spiroplasma apis]|uniref:hypothetical protein n=1 Tax=Spiroplasma apis TaxID=2137 RepID=UPI001183BC7F|nr:hypothetical protein [Spiroplasma apis]
MINSAAVLIAKMIYLLFEIFEIDINIIKETIDIKKLDSRKNIQIYQVALISIEKSIGNIGINLVVIAARLAEKTIEIKEKIIALTKRTSIMSNDDIPDPFIFFKKLVDFHSVTTRER